MVATERTKIKDAQKVFPKVVGGAGIQNTGRETGQHHRKGGWKGVWLSWVCG